MDTSCHRLVASSATQEVRGAPFHTIPLPGVFFTSWPIPSVADPVLGLKLFIVLLCTDSISAGRCWRGPLVDSGEMPSPPLRVQVPANDNDANKTCQDSRGEQGGYRLRPQPRPLSDRPPGRPVRGELPPAEHTSSLRVRLKPLVESARTTPRFKMQLERLCVKHVPVGNKNKAAICLICGDGVKLLF
jgi:hypothetical protein